MVGTPGLAAGPGLRKHITATTLLGALTQPASILQTGRLSLVEAVGLAPGRNGQIRIQASFFLFVSFRGGSSLVQGFGTDCVPSSLLATLNMPSSSLTSQPPGKADILTPNFWRTQVRLRRELTGFKPKSSCRLKNDF